MALTAPSVVSQIIPRYSYEENLKGLSQTHSDSLFPVDYSEFLNNGKFIYKDSEGLKSDGIHVVKHQQVSPNLLTLQRFFRIGATIGSVALNIWSSIKLFLSGFKLLSSTSGFGDVEEAYHDLGSSYNKASIAGVLTGLAHDSPLWALGQAGMGFFSKHLDNISGLSGFSLFDGLSSIGMGQVRLRDKKNTFTVGRSIFNNSILSPLRFLMPLEQSIYSFASRFSSRDGWNRILHDEPYSVFNTSGGGLVAAGGILGLASLFKEKISEKLKSFAYVPYSLFSLVNIIAFWRDGDTQVDRAKILGGRKKEETTCQLAEGNLKKLASPFLGLNNLLLALKGFGLDTASGFTYNIANAVRAWGAALAFGGFTCQSVLNFFNPARFGPKFKEFIKVIVEPKIAVKKLVELINQLTNDKPSDGVKNRLDNLSDQYNKIILNDKYNTALHELIQCDDFQKLFDRHQAGLPTYGNEKTYSRFYLNRGSHSLGTLAIAIKLFAALEQNTQDVELKNYLHENELAFKIASLLHDIGHGPFSHVLDKVVPGADNDENTIRMIANSNSQIHKSILEICHEQGKDGNQVIQKILQILGKKDSNLSLLLSGWGADRIHYERFGDFTFVNNGRVLFPTWDFDNELKIYAETFRLYRENGEIKLGYTKEGALIAFLLCSDRQLFDQMFNGNPWAYKAADLIAAHGLNKRDLSPKQIYALSDNDALKEIEKGINSMRPCEFTSSARFYTGGREKSYSGYFKDPGDPTRIVIVLPNGKTKEFLEYLQEIGIEKYLNSLNIKDMLLNELRKRAWRQDVTLKDFVNELASRIKAATTLKETHVETVIKVTA